MKTPTKFSFLTLPFFKNFHLIQYFLRIRCFLYLISTTALLIVIPIFYGILENLLSTSSMIIRFFENSPFFTKKGCSIQKNIYRENQKLSNYIFCPKSNIWESVYRKLFNSELFSSKSPTLYWHLSFEKSFELIWNMKILKLESDWEDL